MARNPVQFQKGISLNAFLSLYGTEDQCFDTLFQWRWPNGFLCPHCAHDRCCQLTSRKLQQCNRCHRQTSITAGTIFGSTKLALTVWFQAIYLMTQDKKGVKGGEKPDQRAEQNTATAAVGVRWSEGVGMRPGAVSAGNEGRA